MTGGGGGDERPADSTPALTSAMAARRRCRQCKRGGTTREGRRAMVGEREGEGLHLLESAGARSKQDWSVDHLFGAGEAATQR